MLTGMVNIAILAVCRCVTGLALRAGAVFKPICDPRELDVSRYEWQRWQDRGKIPHGCGKVDGKNGTVWQG
jgi:hypothetical protein